MREAQDSCASVTGLGGANRLFAGANAVQPVKFVVVRIVKMDIRDGERAFDQIGGLGFEASAAGYENLTAFADKANHVFIGKTAGDGLIDAGDDSAVCVGVILEVFPMDIAWRDLNGALSSIPSAHWAISK